MLSWHNSIASLILHGTASFILRYTFSSQGVQASRNSWELQLFAQKGARDLAPPPTCPVSIRSLSPICTSTCMLKQSVSPITPSAYTTTTGKFPVTYRAHAFNVQLQSKVKKQLPPQLQQRLAMPMSAPTNTPNMLSQPGIPNPRMRQTLTNKSHNFHTPVPNGLTSFQESFALK